MEEIMSESFNKKEILTLEKAYQKFDKVLKKIADNEKEILERAKRLDKAIRFSDPVELLKEIDI